MRGIDPGEFGRAAAAREEGRREREDDVLGHMLAAGWSGATAEEARRIQEIMAHAIEGAHSRGASLPFNEAALNLVGEARGAALAEWWTVQRGLDERTAALVREVAMAAASMAMIDGVVLGANPQPAKALRDAPAIPRTAPNPRDAVYAGR